MSYTLALSFTFSFPFTKPCTKRNFLISLKIRVRCKALWATLFLATTVGKRNGLSLNAASDSGLLTHRFFITDRNTKISDWQLIGNWSLYISTKIYLWGPWHKPDYELSAANGTIIKTYDNELLTLNFGLQCDFTWKFVVADVSKPIIGADFLPFYGLLVDLRNNQLIDQITNMRATRRCIWLSLREGSSRTNQIS